MSTDPEIPKGSIVGLITLWLISILLVQFATWVTMAAIDVDASWKECGLIAALWTFVAIWFTALRSSK